MATCDPIMMLIEDIKLIDNIAQQRSKLDLCDQKNRKELIKIRKSIIHELIEKGLPFIEQQSSR